MKKLSLVTAIALAASSLSAAPIEELIKGATASGNSFIRYISNTGRNDGGQSFIFRALADLSTGSVEGFSFNLGLFYHYGGTPTVGSDTDSVVDGSRADRSKLFQQNNGNAFGVSTLFAQYAFDASKTAILFGKLRLPTPVTSGVNDRGVGVLATNSDIEGLTIAAAYFDTWTADNQYIGGAMTASNATQGYDIGNNLTAIGFNGDYGVAGFKLWYFNVDRLANVVFGEIKAGNDYEFKAQVAWTGLFNNPLVRFNGGNTYAGYGLGGAKSRGLYTIQVALKPMPEFSARVGYIGSFGRGYGVALNNEASFSKAGRYWYDNFGNGRNGFSLFGQGGNEDSHINIWYIALKSKVSIVDIGLDFVGISGKNFYAVSGAKVNGTKVTIIGTNAAGASERVGNRTFYEVTPQVDINITKQAKLSAYYAAIFGQINMQRFWTQVSYKF